MKRLHILAIYLVTLTATVGAAVFLVYTGEISLDDSQASGGESVRGESSDHAEIDRSGEPGDVAAAADEAEQTAFSGPRLYLVLDDAGHDLDHLRAFMRFPGVFTLAVLPDLKYSVESARMAAAAGHSVILHQPMEALGGQDPGPGAIVVADNEEKIRETLGKNIESIPGIAGINNHMGSKVTGNRRTMEIVIRELADRKLFFLDSRTTAETVAVEVGRDGGVPVMSRDVFLDNTADPEAISVQIDEALSIAREKGWAVMIGHVTVSELADVLAQRYDDIIAAGFRFFPLEDLYGVPVTDS